MKNILMRIRAFFDTYSDNIDRAILLKDILSTLEYMEEKDDGSFSLPAERRKHLLKRGDRFLSRDGWERW
jgi:hypothetical protein